MAPRYADLALETLEKAVADLDADLLASKDAVVLLETYSKVSKLAGFAMAEISRKVGDAATIAGTTGTSMGRAKAVVATGRAMQVAPELGDAMRHGEVSLDQAVEIASAATSDPGSVPHLLDVAHDEGFHVLRDQARKAKLEAEQHRGLAERQKRARCARSFTDELGMVHINLALEPHVATPIVARAEAEAQRIARAAKKAALEAGEPRRIGEVLDEDPDAATIATGATAVEPFERYLADAYTKMLSGSGAKGPAKRPELVVLVSHGVAKRGWIDVRPGEMCKIPGVGPVSPESAKAIAQDAFLNGLFYDGEDLRHLVRWGRDIPQKVRLALELGDAPDFDGVACVDCGNRFRTEDDHIDPVVAGGPTSLSNLCPRCYPCHQAKTERDRKTGRLKPPDP